MDNHIEVLKNLCRICGRKIIANKSYVHPKVCTDYNDILMIYYSIDVKHEQEYPERYPMKLCASCKRKIVDLKKQGLPQEQINSYNFQPHSDEHCFCHGLQKPTPSKKEAPHLRLFDDKFGSNGFTKVDCGDMFKRCFMLCQGDSEGMMSVRLYVYILHNFQWFLMVNNHRLNTKNNPSLSELPSEVNDGNVSTISQLISDLKLCPGCKNVSKLIDEKLDIKQLLSSNAVIESKDGTICRKDSFSIIRHKNCELICFQKDTCDACSKFQNYVYVQGHRLSSETEEVKSKRKSESSKSNVSSLSREDLGERYFNAQKSKRAAIKKIAQQSVTIQNLLEKNGCKVNQEDGDIFNDILRQNKCPFEEETPMWLLWQQQKEISSKKDSRGMRWHPLIIRWCLSIFCSSPAAYPTLASKKTGFLRLPHPSTLKKHLKFTQSQSGFNPEIIQRLIIDSNLKDLEEFRKNVVLVFDEMKIKSGIVFHRSTGKIVGFSEMGAINDEMNSLQNELNDNDDPNSNKDLDLTSNVMVFMVSGIASNLIYPFAYFPSSGFSGHHLYPVITEAIRVLEKIGFKVRALTSDGASPNRKVYIILSHKDNSGDYWGWNICDTSRKIYPFSDIPHLLKTTRNCLENSHGNRNTRNMVLDGKVVSWNHIVQTYRHDLLSRSAVGLRLMPRLTEEHIHLTSRLRMNVKRAAQVMSQTVALALEKKNPIEYASTAKFIRIFDRVFDCLNVSRRYQEKNGKRELAVYEEENDWRFKFLEDEFLVGFLEKWEKEIKAVPDLSPVERSRSFLSKQTADGWQKSVQSFVGLTKELLAEDGIQYILSEKFSQDPLEEHFAKQRRLGGTSDNPNLAQFASQEVKLNVMGSNLMRELRGNTSGSQRERPTIDVSDQRKLPSKKRKTDDSFM